MALWRLWVVFVTNVGRNLFPPIELCPYCASDKLQNVFLEDEVTVLAATTTRAPVPPYDPPFTLAIVDMEDGIRTIGRVEKNKDVKIKKGDKLAVKFGKLFEETEFNKKTKSKRDNRCHRLLFRAERLMGVNDYERRICSRDRADKIWRF